MKKMLALLGVLAVFSLTLTPVYAAESSTWGRIKATFSENQDMTSDEFQLLPGEAFQDPAAKPVRGSKRGRGTPQTTQFVTAKTGGQIRLNVGWAKMKLSINPSALSEDMTVTLSVEKINGIPWFVVAGSVHQTCDPPAKLGIVADIALAGIDLSTLALVHQVEETDPWDVVAAEIEADADEVKKIAELEIKAYLPEFSRYALAASR